MTEEEQITLDDIFGLILSGFTKAWPLLMDEEKRPIRKEVLKIVGEKKPNIIIRIIKKCLKGANQLQARIKRFIKSKIRRSKEIYKIYKEERIKKNAAKYNSKLKSIKQQ